VQLIYITYIGILAYSRLVRCKGEGTARYSSAKDASDAILMMVTVSIYDADTCRDGSRLIGSMIWKLGFSAHYRQSAALSYCSRLYVAYPSLRPVSTPCPCEPLSATELRCYFGDWCGVFRQYVWVNVVGSRSQNLDKAATNGLSLWVAV